MLGVMEGMEFPAERLILSPGDLLFLYTDGVTEAMNGELDMFGESKLQEKISQLSEAGTVEEILTAVRGAVEEHADGTEPSDDITMLGLAYKGS